jgi:hypothetical protein
MPKTASTTIKGAAKFRDADKTVPVEDDEHVDAHRTNHPPAGLAHLDRDETPIRTLQYDPHLNPHDLAPDSRNKAKAQTGRGTPDPWTFGGTSSIR